jgi:hypothetical protein
MISGEHSTVSEINAVQEEIKVQHQGVGFVALEGAGIAAVDPLQSWMNSALRSPMARPDVSQYPKI